MNVFFNVIFISVIAACFSSEVLDQILSDGVPNRVYPGVVAMAGTDSGKIIYSKAFGSFHYVEDEPQTPKLTVSNRFDIASLSKVVATTAAVALLYQKGLISLDMKISDAIEEKSFAQNGKENMTILNCLVHNTGYHEDPIPWYWDPAFNCANTFAEWPTQDFTCMDQIYTSLLNETLNQPPGLKYLYSDLGFVTLQMVVGATVSKHHLVSLEAMRPECAHVFKNSSITHKTNGLKYTCYFEAFVRTQVFQEQDHWLPHTGYLPLESEYSDIVPTLNDTGNGSYTHKRLQGQVSDGDCYAMGGFCGHAGIFSNAEDIGKVLNRWLVLATAEENDVTVGHDNWLNSTTAKLFIKEYNQNQSSRALGWTVNDPLVTDFGFTNSCGNFSTLTFMHTGYSGTCVCVDPVNKLWSVVLTNRAYNCVGQLCPVGSSDPVKAIYKAFHSQLLSDYQAGVL